MLDVFLRSAECLAAFAASRTGLKQLCLTDNTYQPQAVYALCSRVLQSYERLLGYAQEHLASTDPRELNLRIVLLHELARGGLPDKRRRLSRETREAVALLRGVDRSTVMELLDGQVEVTQAPVYFRLNPGRLQAFEERLRSGPQPAITYSSTELQDVYRLSRRPPHGLLGQDLGEFQSLASCLPVECLRALLPGSATVLDLCAAPGSKTIQAAQHFKRVVANELDPKRCEVLKRRCKACSNVVVHRGDAFRFLRNPMARFDAILVDPSCSGSGMAREDAAYGQAADTNRRECDVQRLAAFQKRLLVAALGAAPAFGAKYIVYSTCSVHREENEDVVAHALEQTGAALVKALPAWQIRSPMFPECLRRDGSGEGFFVAVLAVK